MAPSPAGRSVVYAIDVTDRFISNLLARHDRHRRASRAAMRLNYVLNLLQLVKVSSNSILGESRGRAKYMLRVELKL